ncbi:MAG: hypothetical protein MUF29_01820 [Chitinophagaceae bacterium]|nr:hypothetical protein [Chitinophagaceae bacterium]
MKMGWLLCLVFCLQEVVLSQNTIGLPLIRNFSKRDFRGGSQTWDIDQDAAGRMYFANNEGLLVYDGSYWKLFPLPNKTIMRSVRLDSSGRVFVGGQGEAGYFVPGSQGSLQYKSLLGLIPAASRDFADIWDITFHGESVFFRALDRIFELVNNTVQVYRSPNEWVFLQEVGGRLLAQDSREGLFSWNGQEWLPAQNARLVSSDAVQGAMLLGRDSILLATYSNRLFLLAGDSLQPYEPARVSLAGFTYAMTGLNNKEFVMGTTNQGCLVLDRAGQMVQRISISEGLQDNNILCVRVDQDGNLWAGTSHGISLIAYNTPVKYIRPSLTNELAGYSARIFNGQLYLATSDGAYSVPLQPGNPDLSFSKGQFRQIANSQGLNYRIDEINRQLLLAHNEGTFEISGQEARRISPDASWLFLALGKVAPVSRVLVGNYTGLKMLRYRQAGFEALPNLRGTRESLRFLAMDNENRIWASHPYRGIYQISLSGDSMQYSTRLYTDKDGLPSALDNHVFQIERRVVFATEAGVYEFNAATGRFAPSPFLAPALGTMPVRYLKEDADGHIWFVSGKRLGVLVPQAKGKDAYTVTFFPELAGRILSGFENVYPYNRENIFVGAENGFIQINLARYLQASRRPRILLSAVHAFGETDSLISNGFSQSDPAAKSRGEREKFRLPYRLNALHFEFSSPAYGYQDNVEYSFLLEGYDREWSRWNTRTEKDYTNLPPGDYVFRVKARSNLGTESEALAYHFVVAPPWYKSGLAYGIYALMLIAFAYWLRHWHHRNLARQRRLYEEKQEQLRVLHQLELEKNEKEIIRLQNEKLASEVSFKNRELADTAMHLVERSDALAKVKEELQRLYKSNAGNEDIKKAIHLLSDIERSNSDWDRFAASFDEINNDFLKKLRAQYPGLTNNDLKLCAYLQLKMSSKEIAQLLNISTRGVEIGRYRLRKKLGIPTEQSLGEFLNSIV